MFAITYVQTVTTYTDQATQSSRKGGYTMSFHTSSPFYKQAHSGLLLEQHSRSNNFHVCIPTIYIPNTIMSIYNHHIWSCAHCCHLLNKITFQIHTHYMWDVAIPPQYTRDTTLYKVYRGIRHTHTGSTCNKCAWSKQIAKIEQSWSRFYSSW